MQFTFEDVVRFEARLRTITVTGDDPEGTRVELVLAADHDPCADIVPALQARVGQTIVVGIILAPDDFEVMAAPGGNGAHPST